MEKIRCRKCGELKEEIYFTLRTDTHKFRTECKECEKKWKNKWYREYYSNNPELSRERRLKQNYNLTSEKWLEIWKFQGKKCAICEKSFNGTSDACIDHNHQTGEIRGLLCRQCNAALGLFKDDLETLNNAIKYLE